MQPHISEAFELSTAADTQLKVLKEYDAYAQKQAGEASAEVLQDLSKKEQAADNIMRSLNKRYTLFIDKVRGLEGQQSVPGQDTGES